MTPHDWQKPVDVVAGVPAGRRRHPHAGRARAARWSDDGLLVLMNAHHEPMHFKLPGGRGGRRAGCSRSTPATRQGEARRCERYEVAARAMVVCGSRSRRCRCAAPRPDASRDGGGRAGAGHQEGGAAAAPAGRDRHPAVLDPRRERLGPGRDPRHLPRFATLGGQGRLLGAAALARQRGGRPAIPAPTPPARRSRSIRPTCRSTRCEDFAAAGGREALARRPRADARGAEDARARSTGRGVRALKHAGHRARVRRFLRDEWRPRTSRAPRSWPRSCSDNRVVAGRLRAFHRAARRSCRSLAGLAAAACAIAPRTRSRRCAGEHGDALLRKAWLQWQLDLQWRRARREASELGVELMGDLPFVVGIDSADVWANRAVCSAPTSAWARRPTTPRRTARTGALPVYDWTALRSDDFAWMRARASPRRASSSASTASTTRSASTGPSPARPTARPAASRPADDGAQIRLGETLMRIMRHFGEVVAEDLGTVAAVPAPVARAASASPGYRVLRWEKDGDVYRDPADWPRDLGRDQRAPTTPTRPPTGTTGLARRANGFVCGRSPPLRDLDPAQPFDDQVRDAAAARRSTQRPRRWRWCRFRTRWARASGSTSPGTVARQQLELPHGDGHRDARQRRGHRRTVVPPGHGRQPTRPGARRGLAQV